MWCGPSPNQNIKNTSHYIHTYNVFHHITHSWRSTPTDAAIIDESCDNLIDENFISSITTFAP